MKWFTAAVFEKDTRIRSKIMADQVVVGPFESSLELAAGLRQYRRELSQTGFTAIIVPFDTVGDEVGVEVGEFDC